MGDIVNLRMPVITGIPDVKTKRPSSLTGTQATDDFAGLLQKRLEEQKSAQSKTLTLSKHAQVRASERNIEITETDMERLDQAIAEAGGKGITDTLVFLNKTAFIVNVPSKVVVTMVDTESSDPTIFTNIDGAVIL